MVTTNTEVGHRCKHHNIISETFLLVIIMRSLHDVHEMNAYSAVHVCPSVHIIQLESRWTNLD
jgi:hypothetical protein